MTTESSTPSTTSLSALPTGQRARIVDIDGPRNQRHRLLGLGLHSGGHLIILQRRGRGMVVAIGAARVALGNDVAGLLQVEALD